MWTPAEDEEEEVEGGGEEEEEEDMERSIDPELVFGWVVRSCGATARWRI